MSSKKGESGSADLQALVSSLGELTAEVVRVPGEEVAPELLHAERAVTAASERVAALVLALSGTATGDEATLLRGAIEALADATEAVSHLRVTRGPRHVQ